MLIGNKHLSSPANSFTPWLYCSSIPAIRFYCSAFKSPSLTNSCTMALQYSHCRWDKLNRFVVDIFPVLRRWKALRPQENWIELFPSIELCHSISSFVLSSASSVYRKNYLSKRYKIHQPRKWTFQLKTPLAVEIKDNILRKAKAPRELRNSKTNNIALKEK